MPSQGVDVLKTGILATSSFLLVLFLLGLTQGSAHNNDRLSRSLQTSLPSYSAVDARHATSINFSSATKSNFGFKHPKQKPSWILVNIDEALFKNLRNFELVVATPLTPWFYSSSTNGNNKLNGWKEGNILYTGKLNFHD